MADPAAVLTAPEAHPMLPPALNTYLHIGDLVSIGHWAMVAIEFMGGPKIPEEVGKWFAGDWAEVSRSADALRKLGTFCEAMGDEVVGATNTVRADWDGAAAGAAADYFLRLAGGLRRQKTNFDDIAHQYEKTAFGVKELASACGSLLESLIDWAIAAGISLAAAAASSWTVVGGVLGSGAAGYSIYRGAMTVKEILEIRAKVWTACEALIGLISGPLGSLNGFTAVALPAGYDNPQVDP